MDQSDNNNQPTVPPTSVAAQQDPQMNATPPSGAADLPIPTQTQQENMSQTDNNPQITVSPTPAVAQQDQPFVANPPAAPVETPAPAQDQQANIDASSSQQPASDTAGAEGTESVSQGDLLLRSGAPRGIAASGENTTQEGDYVTNVGVSMVDLFTDISMSEERKQKVAETMRISVAQVATIVEQLLDKIDNEQITEEELAFIISSPVADEVDEANNPS